MPVLNYLDLSTAHLTEAESVELSSAYASATWTIARGSSRTTTAPGST
jgi:hypothetical protein